MSTTNIVDITAPEVLINGCRKNVKKMKICIIQFFIVIENIM